MQIIKMLADDNLLCCLLPSKCNQYSRPIVLQIISTVFFGFNCLVVMYKLATIVYSIWLIWNEYMKVLKIYDIQS